MINVISGKLINSNPNFKGFPAVSDKINRKSNSSGTETKSLETTASPTIVICFTTFPSSSTNSTHLGGLIVFACKDKFKSGLLKSKKVYFPQLSIVDKHFQVN